MTNSKPVVELKSSAENLTDHVSDYVETWIKLSKVNATKKVTEAAISGVTALLVLFFLLIILIFLGFGVAAWLGESMPTKQSYLIVALGYLLLAAGILLIRKRLIFPFLRDHIVNKIYERDH